jgi:DNA (cytosine-5)-methyltransferase 1
MRAVELFAGIGGFRMAADLLRWQTVWANDSSRLACAVYRDRFGPDVLHESDFHASKGSVPEHDVLTGGFPCQSFSSAGKKEGIRDPRGTLFQLIVDVVQARRPRFFVLENVKRLLTMEAGCHFATILGSLAGLDYTLEWRLLNAMHFGLPQNRERVVIVGTRAEQPHDAVIRLASIEDFASLDDRQRELLVEPRRWTSITNHRARFPKWGLAAAGRFHGMDLERFHAARQPMSLASVLEPTVSPDFDFTDATLKWVGGNTPVNRFVNGVEILSNQRGGARMGYTIFGTRGVAPTLTSTTSRHYERYRVGERYRRLTNVEYARIQGFPDDHCRVAPIYDQYALYGNAVPPPLIEWVMGRLTSRGMPLCELSRRAEPTPLDSAR